MTIFPATDFYYDLLERLVERLSHAAARLEAVLAGSAPAEPGRAPADQLLEQVRQRLTSSSVAPFDRHEINDLAFRLEEATALLTEATATAQLFAPGGADAAARRIGGALEQAARVLASIVCELRAPEQVGRRVADELLPLVDQADALYGSAVEGLFGADPDPLDAVRRLSLYDQLQSALRALQELGGMLERIALKEG